MSHIFYSSIHTKISTSTRSSQSSTRCNSTCFRRRSCLRLLWPWPLTFDLISTWPNCSEISCNIYKDTVFIRFSGHCLLWPWPLTFRPQKLISISANRTTSVTKIGWNSLHYFWDMAFTMFSICTDSRTHSLTDGHRPEYRMPPATFFNSGGGTTIRAQIHAV